MVRPAPVFVLQEAVRAMTWGVVEGRYALAGFPEAPAPEDLALLGEGPGQLVRERDETTLLLAEERLVELLARHPAAKVQRDLAWIRFDVPLDWQLVGFLALVSGALAAEGVPLGAVCGYSRDHLFVAGPYLERTRSVLSRLFRPTA